MMRHRKIEELLAVYRSLDASQRQRVDEHVTTCPTCRAQLAAYREIDRALTSLPSPAPDRFLRDLVLGAIAEDDNAGLPSHGRRLVLQGFPLGAALAILLVASITAISIAGGLSRPSAFDSGRVQPLPSPAAPSNTTPTTIQTAQPEGVIVAPKIEALLGEVLRRVRVSTSHPLPIPATVADAVLINLRPLTHRRAYFGAWTPDGSAVVYREYKKALWPMSLLRIPPKSIVKQVRIDGGGVQRLGEGHPLFLSPDGRTLYLHNGDGGVAELWAKDLASGSMRQVATANGRIFAQRLDDGRVVLDNVSGDGPLLVFDPVIRNLANLTVPFQRNVPDGARVSPDGTRLAYATSNSVYLANADGSNAQPIFQGEGSASPQMWWSPDSQLLAYTTGLAGTDRLLLADRDGRTLATLVPSPQDFGWVSQVEWSADSQRMLVLSRAISEDQPQRLPRLFVMDTTGHSQLLLEDYLKGVAWSPDGRTIALDRWDGPQGELNTDNVWLAELTDRATLARLPAPTARPVPSPTPSLPLPPVDMSPEDVIRRFWAAIDAGDYRTAYAATSTDTRAGQSLAYFRATWECVKSARVLEITPKGDSTGDARMFTTQIAMDLKSSCDGKALPGTIMSLVRETPDGSWLIRAFLD